MARNWQYRLKAFLLFLLGLVFSLGIDLLPANSQLTSFPEAYFPEDAIATQEIVQNTELTTNTEQLLQYGKISYQSGNFSLAAKLLTQAANIYQSQGDILNQVLVLNYLSLTQQKLGNLQQANENVKNSFRLLDRLKLNSQPAKRIFALTLNTQGNLQLAQGEAEEAIESWKQAAKTYDEIDDKAGRIGSQINEIAALQTLGFYRRGLKIFNEIEQNLQVETNLRIKVAGLRSLGDAKRANGDLKKSQNLLQQSLLIAEKLASPQEESATLLSLGNTAFSFAKRSQLKDLEFGNRDNPLPFNCGRTAKNSDAIKNYQNSANYYQKSANKSISIIAKVQAKLNRLRALLELQQQPTTEELRSLQAEIGNLIPSRTAVYAKVNFAQSLVCLTQQENTDRENTNQENTNQENTNLNLKNVARLLKIAVDEAKGLKDPRAESYALGNLARLYEYTKQWEIARKYTELALKLAQAIDASDITYQWEWQLGRVLFAQGNSQGAISPDGMGIRVASRKESITAYTLAIESLKSLRSDLLTLNPDTQFDFRDEVEPVYRQLVTLLLEPSDMGSGDISSGDVSSGEKISQENLKQARDVIEALQLAEIDNFFRDACSIAEEKRIDQIVDDAKVPTAAIYPIILPDRIEIIIKLTGVKELRHYTTKKPQKEVEDPLKQLREKLQRRYTFRDREELSQKVYDWLIAPIEKDLQQNQVKNLVFVLDGWLRNIPMAALYDGKQYLMEQYSIALAPGLQLVASSKEEKKIAALKAGITEPHLGFSALPHVATELETIQSAIPGKKLLNQSFTNQNIEQQVTSVSYPIVHLATHGEFSSQLENTFILAWDGKINAKELKGVLQSREELQGKRFREMTPIELLVLSACETATGDKRATLGLAGIAVRSGARSTIASLWRVDDESTSVLMAEFYQQLTKNPTMSKAEALRHAQELVFREYKEHPFYWAPYVLVGNWF